MYLRHYPVGSETRCPSVHHRRHRSPRSDPVDAIWCGDAHRVRWRSVQHPAAIPKRTLGRRAHRRACKALPRSCSRGERPSSDKKVPRAMRWRSSTFELRGSCLTDVYCLALCVRGKLTLRVEDGINSAVGSGFALKMAARPRANRWDLGPELGAPVRPVLTR